MRAVGGGGKPERAPFAEGVVTSGSPVGSESHLDPSATGVTLRHKGAYCLLARPVESLRFLQVQVQVQAQHRDDGDDRDRHLAA
ncbi:hypothetical protein [Kineococcus sp. R86509]|uniref:hypothetical protein n=1 Tax=Kineococcus sp. R86509 TaxID=3093851 RepID=UPI0036D36E6D